MQQASVLLSTQEKSIEQRSSRRDLVEIAIGYVLILIVIWTPRPWQQYFWFVAVLGIGIVISASRDNPRSLGLRGGRFLSSMWVAGVAAILSVVAVAIAARMHTLRSFAGPLEFAGNFWSYALWAGVQQFLLQGFFLSRISRLVRKPGYAAMTAAGLFALAHLPNPVLTILTIVWGTLACLVFLRYRSLYSLAIAHAILGITIAMCVPGHVDHNMRVGLGYLRYRKGWTRPPIQRSHKDQIASTDAWVTAEAATRRSLLQARP